MKKLKALKLCLVLNVLLSSNIYLASPVLADDGEVSLEIDKINDDSSITEISSNIEENGDLDSLTDSSDSLNTANIDDDEAIENGNLEEEYDLQSYDINAISNEINVINNTNDGDALVLNAYTISGHDANYNKTLTVDFGSHTGVEIGVYYWLSSIETEGTNFYYATSDKSESPKYSLENKTKIQIKNCLNSERKLEGYLLFIIRPKTGYVFTGVKVPGADGNEGDGQIWLINDNNAAINPAEYSVGIKDQKEYNSGLSNYPKLVEVLTLARSRNYTTCFAWSNEAENIGSSTTIKFSAEASAPSMDIEVVVKDNENNKNLAPGKVAQLEVKVTPTLSETGPRITNTATKVEIVKVNGKNLTLELTENGTKEINGKTYKTYSCDAYYTITEEDFKNGYATFSASGTVSYDSVLKATSGDVKRSNTVTATGEAKINLKDKIDTNSALLTYKFEKDNTSTSDDLPKGVMDLLPIFKTTIITADPSTGAETKEEKDVNYQIVNITDLNNVYTPSFDKLVDKVTRVQDGTTNNYWIFQGWNPDSVKYSDMSTSKDDKGNVISRYQDFVGKWSYLNTSIDIDIDGLGLDANTVSKVYDGTPLKAKVTATDDTTSNNIVSIADNNGITLTYYTADDNGDWVVSNDEPSLTNVGTLKVKVEASKTGYETKSAEYTLEVTKRPVSFTGNSASLTYTGVTLSVSGVTVSVNGLVGNATHNVTAIASGRTVGKYTGSITPIDDIVITMDGENVTKNYEIITVPGTLIITEAPSNEEPKIITCEEYMNSKNWTWSEAKKACVYKVSNTSAD